MKTKTKNILTWILSLILAFAYIAAGLSKILGADMQIKNLESWGFPLWTRFPIGISEVVLAIGLILTYVRQYAVWAIYFWALVAIATHLQAGQPNMIGGAVIIAIMNTVLLIIMRIKEKK